MGAPTVAAGIKIMNKLILVVLAIAFSATAATAQKESDRPLITVTGQAEIMVVPDEVVYRLRVVTMERELPAAQLKNDQVVKSLLALARRFLIPPELVQTGQISVTQRFSDESVTKRPPVLVGYTVTKAIAFILKDVSKAEGLLTEIFQSGVSTIDSVQFRTSQSRKYKDQARAMAIKAAQEKAIALTREIGQSIGKAHTIQEEDQPPYAPSNANYSGFARSEVADASTIALGQISISARVMVSFELK